MRISGVTMIAVLAGLGCGAHIARAGGLPELTERAHAAGRTDKGVVLLHVNWGRKWECAGLKPTNMTLTFKNGLLTNSGYQGYALLLDPGIYAVGGSFDVAAGEFVYIGHFAIDCAPQPMVWRFCIEGRKAWEQYLLGMHKQFPCTTDAPVTYRLFATETLGTPYSLPAP